ncbi:MAG: deaminase domain-containing protein, partial [Cyanobacteria bacterium P01_A01_bin.83]
GSLTLGRNALEGKCDVFEGGAQQAITGAAAGALGEVAEVGIKAAAPHVKNLADNTFSALNNLSNRRFQGQVLDALGGSKNTKDAGALFPDANASHGGYNLQNVPVGREGIHTELAVKAQQLRDTVIKKPLRKGNVAAGRLEFKDGTVLLQEASSRAKGPLPKKPIPKSQGGLFEPTIDNRTGRVMDTDSEFKLFDYFGHQLDKLPKSQQKGTLDIFTEMSMCESCISVKSQFKERFPGIEINVSHKIEFLQ